MARTDVFVSLSAWRRMRGTEYARQHLQGIHLQPSPSAWLPVRTADHYAQATTSLYKLRGLLQQAAAGGAGSGDAAAPAWALAMSVPDASWRVEEAKLLWEQGQQDTAVQLARNLLGARCCGMGGGACWVVRMRGIHALCRLLGGVKHV